MDNNENTITSTTPGALLDAVIARLEVPNDAALSRALGVAPPTISKMRSGSLPIGATMLLRMHDIADMAIADLRALLGAQPYRRPAAAIPSTEHEPV